MGKKVVLGARVDEQINKALDEAKWALKMPKGRVVEEAIKEYLKRHCPEVYEEFLNEQRQRNSKA